MGEGPGSEAVLNISSGGRNKRYFEQRDRQKKYTLGGGRKGDRKLQKWEGGRLPPGKKKEKHAETPLLSWFEEPSKVITLLERERIHSVAG